MAAYRLYAVDGFGRIGLAVWIRARTDSRAIRKAQLIKHGGKRCEVWEGKRLVARLGANDLA